MAVVMEEETTSGKPLANFLRAEGMEGVVAVMEGEATSDNYWQNFLWRRAWRGGGGYGKETTQDINIGKIFDGGGHALLKNAEAEN